MSLQHAHNYRPDAQRRSRLRPVPAPPCDRCAHLEHLPHEERGQELTGITLMLAAARRAPTSASALDQALASIAGLLGAAIGRCRRDPQRS